jgi:hypothetical protein
MKTASTTTTTTTTTSNRRIRSFCLAKYIKLIQQANERTAAEYEYRLSTFSGLCDFIKYNGPFETGMIWGLLAKEDDR